ncbi:unnamed protein product [Bemisia tabaci]|uniref:Uncharacterized protein n=1 Tax=Bemisia tabaci TaxID=7038 RepID=A0A9P0EX19_BEMTA|nr:unnamed protein product [Bemisia tabaci]
MLSSFVVSLRKLHKELSEFEEQTDSLFDLLPSKRAGKRGLCDGLGKPLSCVTGVVDRDEADELQANIQEMEAKEGDLKLEVSANKLMVKNILEQAVNNTEVTGSMARKLFVSDNSIAELKEWSAVETKLRALNFWVQKIKMDRGELRLGLENALNKRLSPESLAPKKLKTVLEAIEASIPKRFELITDKEGLEEFYAVVQRAQLSKSLTRVTVEDHRMRQTGDVLRRSWQESGGRYLFRPVAEFWVPADAKERHGIMQSSRSTKAMDGRSRQGSLYWTFCPSHYENRA